MNWILYALLAVALTGTAAVLAKSGIKKANANLGAALWGTVLFAAAVLVGGAFGCKPSLGSLGSGNLITLLFIGIVTAGMWICLMRALQLGEVICVIPILEGSVLVRLLLGMIFFRDGVTWNKVIFCVLLAVGLLLIIIRPAGKSTRKSSGSAYALAVIALGGVIYILERRGLHDISVYNERTISYGVALVIVWTIALVTGGFKGLRAMSFLDGILLCGSAVGIGMAWFAMGKAYGLGDVFVVSVMETFDVVAAVMLATVFLREHMTLRRLSGLLLLMLVFILMQLDLPVLPI